MNTDSCCILNAGGGAWAFESLARDLSDALWIDVSQTPRQFNYLLSVDDVDRTECGDLFVPLRAMRIAADKRLLADTFNQAGVSVPETRLIPTLAEAKQILQYDPARQWCLKFPTSCGGSGHRLLSVDTRLPESWPLPLVVQEFIPLDHPEVYRTYAAGGHLFGWVVRRFPVGIKVSPWVAHARGARYESAGDPPLEASRAARSALDSVGLLQSFGCVDLIRRPDGAWLVLEVGTDGLFNHVDRELGLPVVETELRRRVAEAFWSRFEGRPWGVGEWRPRNICPKV